MAAQSAPDAPVFRDSHEGAFRAASFLHRHAFGCSCAHPPERPHDSVPTAYQKATVKVEAKHEKEPFGSRYRGTNAGFII